MATLTLTEVADYLKVSAKTVRKWEDVLSQYIQSARDGKNGRHYTEESIKRLEQVAKLRDRGLSIEMVQEIFAILHAGDEAAVGNAMELVPEYSTHAMVAEMMEAFHSHFDIISKDHVDDLKQFVDHRLQAVSMSQAAILEVLGSRRDKHKRRQWFKKADRTT